MKDGKCTKLLTSLLLAMAMLVTMFVPSHVRAVVGTVSGDMMVWHPVTITFDGPDTSEDSTTNPFRDYRLDVTFTGPNGQVYRVPGYYAADGKAAETSASSGNKWQVKFCPDESGLWNYSVSFVTGTNVAANLSGGTGAGYFDGGTGAFNISPSDKSGDDFRSKGKLEYVDGHYWKFKGTGEYFLKAGANSPETLLENTDIDATPGDTNFSTMASYWQADDPVWKTNKGKGSIGIVNYIAAQGANVHYFLLMNSYGDGKDCFPWRVESEYDRYDCSKLDQWDIIFSQFDKKGVMLDFVLSETENSSYLEVKDNGSAGGFSNARKIFYREMVARFGYHLGVTWNIGEEINWNQNETTTSYGYPPTITQMKDFADRIRALTYYKDHIVVHNGPTTDDKFFNDLLGHNSMSGVSMQQSLSSANHNDVLEWRNKSASNGHKWIVSLDEPYTTAVPPDLDTYRKQTVWGTFMAGGAGVELYLNKDQSITDYTPYASYYQAGQKACNFFTNNVKELPEMVPGDNLVNNGNWCLAKSGVKYVIYLPSGGTTNLNLSGTTGTYDVKWYDPRNGGDLQNGTITSVSGGGTVNIGNAANNTTSDWVVMVSKSSAIPTPTHTPTPTPPIQSGDGLTGNYYDNNDLTNLKLTRVDSTINFDWGAGSPDASIDSETFSARWTGQVKADYTETYTFYVYSNDGNRLWVNGKLLTDRWTTGISEQSGTISLIAGQKYDIVLEMFETNKTALCQLSWSSPSTPKVIIPTANLYSSVQPTPTPTSTPTPTPTPTPSPTPTPTPPIQSGDGLLGSYYDNDDLTSLKLTRVDSTVNFDWGAGSPDASIDSDTFSVRWTGQVKADYTETYTFYVYSNDGNRLWVNGKLLTDRWTTGISEQSGTISLVAGQKYDIVVETFETINTAFCQLSWSSPSTPKAIIPTSNLYSSK